MKRIGAVAIVTAALFCAPAAPPPTEGAARARRPVPKIPATVLTVRESSHPPTRAYLHKIVVAGTKVRLGDESDQWRLFDLHDRTVTWVDDVTKTYRTFSLDDLVRMRERQLRQRIPAADLGRARVLVTTDIREIAGIPSRRVDIRLGGYEREVWLSTEPLIAPHFLRMLVASEPISEPWAGVMADVERALMNARGFPLLDRSRLAWEGGEMLFQRRLLRVETKDVPAAWVTIPPDYVEGAPPSAP